MLFKQVGVGDKFQVLTFFRGLDLIQIPLCCWEKTPSWTESTVNLKRSTISASREIKQAGPLNFQGPSLIKQKGPHGPSKPWTSASINASILCARLTSARVQSPPPPPRALPASCVWFFFSFSDLDSDPVPRGTGIGCWSDWCLRRISKHGDLVRIFSPFEWFLFLWFWWIVPWWLLAYFWHLLYEKLFFPLPWGWGGALRWADCSKYIWAHASSLIKKMRLFFVMITFCDEFVLGFLC